MQWKVEVKADYGSNSQASLDGYVIKDAAFIAKTLNSENVSGYITYNAWSRNGNVNAKDYLTFDGPDAQGNVTIHVRDSEPVYEINFFVDQTYENATYTSGSYNDYKAGNEVTMQNYAEGGNTTFGVSDSGTIDYTTKMVDEVTTKNYTGTDSSLYVMGNPESEETTKVLPWEVIAKREGGIDATVTVTDELLETVTGSHYITPEQAAQNGWLSVIKSDSSSFETFSEVDSSDYEVLFYETAESTVPIANFTDQTEKNATKIEVKFKSSLNAIFAKVSYSSTADLSKVTPGNVGQFNNKAKTKGDYKEKSGLTFTREDPTQVKNFYLHVLKRWSDANNAKGNRPTTLTFTVERTTGDPDAETAQWETVGTSYTANMSASYGSEEVWLKDSSNQDLKLPQWDSQGNRYYYRVMETMPENSGYAIKSQDAPFLAQFEDNATKTYSITNAPETELKKLAINAEGETVTELEYSDIPCVTINETEYYMFRWKVEAIVPKESPAVYFHEVLPDGAIFIGPEIVSNYQLDSKYKPIKKFTYNSEQEWYHNNTGKDLRYTLNGNNITITVDEGQDNDLEYFSYYLALPVSSYPDLADGGILISNTISDADMAMTATMAIPSVMMSASAAASENTISFTQEKGVTHKYTGYQIFKGTVEGDELKSVQWAMDATKAGSFLTALKGSTLTLADGTTKLGSLFNDCTTAASVAEVLGGTTFDTAANVEIFAEFAASQTANLLKVNDTASATVDIGTTGDGYYLVIDETSATITNGAYSRYILNQVDASTGIEVAVKSSIPTVVKKVQENVKTGDWEDDASYGDRYNDVADYSIGDDVPFELIATLPSGLADYDHYYLKFTDHLDPGFVAPSGNFVVTVGSTDAKTVVVPAIATGETSATKTEGNITVTVKTVDTGTDIEVVIMDVKAAGYTVAASDKVKVEYSSKLDTDAVIGRGGNYNDVKLEYSNNPNSTGDGTSKPTDTNETPKDGVVVFTYEADITKYDSADATKALLAGAKFVVMNSNGTKYLNQDLSDGGTGNRWVTIATAPTTVAGWEASEATIFTSSAANKIAIAGLDDGTYQLKEIAAPAGFNPLDTPVSFTITATTTNAQNRDAIGEGNSSSGRTGAELEAIKVTYDSKEVSGNVETGAVDIEVANSSGATLPSTGGIGTTLFVLGGGCAAGVAGIYLVSRKRTKEEETE